MKKFLNAILLGLHWWEKFKESFISFKESKKINKLPNIYWAPTRFQAIFLKWAYEDYDNIHWSLKSSGKEAFKKMITTQHSNCSDGWIQKVWEKRKKWSSMAFPHTQKKETFKANGLSINFSYQ